MIPHGLNFLRNFFSSLVRDKDLIYKPKSEIIEQLRLKIADGFSIDCFSSAIEYYEDISTKGYKLKGDMDRNIKVVVHIGNIIPIEFQWYRFSKSTDGYVKVGNAINIELNNGDIYILSEKAIGNDCNRKSVLSIRHSLGIKYLKKE